MYDASEPIRQTETYKVVSASVSEVLEDVGSNTRYGGFIEKEARRRRREARLKKLGRDGMAKRPPKMAENPEAGENIVLHANASAEPTTASSSSSMRDKLPKPISDWLANAGETYRESDNVFISMSRGVTNAFHRFFVEENETARVVRWMKTLDPDFQMEAFLRELREYIVPEIVDAFVSADVKTLKQWTSEATYNVLTAQIQPYIQQGLVSTSEVRDIRGVDVSEKDFWNTDRVYDVMELADRDVTISCPFAGPSREDPGRRHKGLCHLLAHPGDHHLQGSQDGGGCGGRREQDPAVRVCCSHDADRGGARQRGDGRMEGHRHGQTQPGRVPLDSFVSVSGVIML